MRVIVGLFALINMGYGIVGYFKPSQIFENSTEGVDVNGNGARYAGYEYASRNLSIGAGLLLAAVIGSPQVIIVVMAIRALVELQSILINASLKKINEGFLTAVIFLVIELCIIIKLFM